MRAAAAAAAILVFLLLASFAGASFAGPIQRHSLQDADSHPEGTDGESWGDTVLLRFSVGALLPAGELDFIDRLTRIALGAYVKTTDRLYLGGSLQFMFPTVSGTAGGYALEKGGGGGSLELGAIVYLLSRTPRIQPYLGLSVGAGGIDWVYAEQFPEGVPEDVAKGTGMLYLATQVGADWGPLSVGTRFLLTRHVVDDGLGLESFEEKYGRGNYLEIYLALVARDI